MHFLNDKWEFCHVTINFLETIDTSRSVMIIQVTNPLVKHMFNVHVFPYGKDERSNISTMTFVLTAIVFCEVLGLSFCRGLLGSYNVQVLAICHR